MKVATATCYQLLRAMFHHLADLSRTGTQDPEHTEVELAAMYERLAEGTADRQTRLAADRIRLRHRSPRLVRVYSRAA